MRLPTNNLALSAVGFVALVVLVPWLMIMLYALRFWKVRANPFEFICAILSPERQHTEPGEPATLRNLFEALSHVRLL